MCGLFASRSYDEILELANANSYRGSTTHSISYFENGELVINKYNGQWNPENLPKDKEYYICHIQAPTSTTNNAHPAIVDGKHVWHNGIIKDKCIKDLCERYNFDTKWDTELIARTFPALGDIDGTFACFFFKNTPLVFRNEISPLFCNGTTFSSVKTKLTPAPLEPNKVFMIHDEYSKLFELDTFKTHSNPYFFM